MRATRAQADRILYKAAIRRRLENQPGLWLFQQAVEDLMLEVIRVVGIKSRRWASRFRARGVVLPPARFWTDASRRPGQLRGRARGRSAGVSSLHQLKGLRLPQGRLKTGAAAAGRTQHRLQPLRGATGRRHARQAGLPALPVFSFLGGPNSAHASCRAGSPYQRRATGSSAGLDRQPMFTEQDRRGGAALPSVEDKITASPTSKNHQIFLGPGPDHPEDLPNGISTSLPFDVQYALVALHPQAGERPHHLRPGYAIGHDYHPRSLRAASKAGRSPDLFFAGQVNGTTGYEAAQGLFAGINAALVPGRITLGAGSRQSLPGRAGRRPHHQGVTEPLPDVPSRAGVPVAAARDNADMRLTEVGRRLGLVDDARWDAFCRKRLMLFT